MTHLALLPSLDTRRSLGLAVAAPLLATAMLFACAGPEAHETPGPELSQRVQPLSAPNAVTDWSARAQAAIAPGRGSGSAAYLQAMVQLAVYDAVVAIQGTYEPFNAGIAAVPGANLPAAVAAAARQVIRQRVPSQAAAIDAQYATYLAGIPDGESKTDGITLGEAAAAGIITARAGDNFGSNLPYVQPPIGPGVWEPTLPTAPVDYNLQFVIPFTSDSPASFRPGPPPALTSWRYAMDLLEVEALGRANSTVRTAQQLDVARFWSESAFTLWTRGIRNLAIARGLDELEAARLMAMTSLAAADTLISCWEAKYHYFAWRPVHAITRADTDGNPWTVADPTWTALLNQNHPEYPAGHACFGAAMVTALRRYFRSSFVSMSLDSTAAGLTSPVHQYERLAEINDEVEGARIWAGVHFRHTLRVSRKLGETVAKHALHGRFHRLKDCQDLERDDSEDDQNGHDHGPRQEPERH